jgi:hypothetical protein
MMIYRFDRSRPFDGPRDLIYAAFRLAACATIHQVEAAESRREPAPDRPRGPLDPVPMLGSLPLAVQFELLGRAYRLHADGQAHRADLLLGATVYAVCWAADRMLREEPALADQWLRAGPRRVRLAPQDRESGRLPEAFGDFWSPHGETGQHGGGAPIFVYLDVFTHMESRPVDRAVRRMGGWQDLRSLMEVLLRRQGSPQLLDDLSPILHPAEIFRVVRLSQLHEVRRSR